MAHIELILVCMPSDTALAAEAEEGEEGTVAERRALVLHTLAGVAAAAATEAQRAAMASTRAETLRRALATFFAKVALTPQERSEKVENLVARVVGGPPSCVGGMVLGGVLWSEAELFVKLSAKYGEAPPALPEASSGASPDDGAAASEATECAVDIAERFEIVSLAAAGHFPKLATQKHFQEAKEEMLHALLHNTSVYRENKLREAVVIAEQIPILLLLHRLKPLCGDLLRREHKFVNRIHRQWVRR